MPELPEVQTTVSGLQQYIQSKHIKKVNFHRTNIRYPLDLEWISRIENTTIEQISRRAKLIIMQLNSGYLLWHLGMSGSLRISDSNEPRRKHDHVELYLTNDKILRFHDPRRFGFLKWFADRELLENSFAHYGVEPLEDSFTAQYLYTRSRKKKQAVKNFIMNQEVVVGVGNIYACEALFMAGINPQTASGKISMVSYTKLVDKIQYVLQRSINLGGTTLRDFENAEAQPGYFQQSLFVYGRAGELCKMCKNEIQSIKIGGRNSFYCSCCQK